MYRPRLQHMERGKPEVCQNQLIADGQRRRDENNGGTGKVVHQKTCGQAVPIGFLAGWKCFLPRFGQPACCLYAEFEQGGVLPPILRIGAKSV